MTHGTSIRLLIVDDHRVVRAGIAAILAEAQDMEVLAGAGTVAEAVALAHSLRPDIVVMDMRLPDGSGAEACRRIKAAAPGVRVVVLSSFAEEPLVFEAISAGVDGYLLKDSEDQALVVSLRAVANGEQVLSPAVVQVVLRTRSRGANESWHRNPMKVLTPRELSIIKLVSEGCTYKEVGARLGIAEKTVRNGISLMLDKLGYVSRSQLIAAYTRSAANGGA